MKYNFLIVLAITIALASCVKENTPDVPFDNTVDTTVAMPGGFMNGPFWQYQPSIIKINLYAA
jgi:hypothetical protein